MISDSNSLLFCILRRDSLQIKDNVYWQKMKSIHEFDEYVDESTSINPPQNGEAITPTSDDPDQYYSSSSESSTSATIIKNHSRKRRSKKLIRQFRELSSIVLASSNKVPGIPLYLLHASICLFRGRFFFPI